MNNQKATGAYYTPNKLSNFIVNYLNNKLDNKLSILEPSVGDGSFVDAISSNLKQKQIELTILDINKNELAKAKAKTQNFSEIKTVLAINEDFLKFYKNHDKKYSLIIGNPPYIKSNLLSKMQIMLIRNIHDDCNLSDKKINNIWTAFVLGCTKLLADDGILSFVLPNDLLQVKYSEELRKYLEKEFERIEIFTLDKSIFKDIDQETIILFAYKKSQEKGTFFFQIHDFEKNEYKKISSNGLMIYESKWTHYLLSSEEIHLLNKINSKLKRIDEYVTSRPGIVTGANSFFIIDKNTRDEYKLKKYIKPIFQRSLFINRNIEIKNEDMEKLIDKGKPSLFLKFKDTTKMDKHLEKYLQIGKDQKLHERYKCSIRDNWYVVPNIAEPSEGFIFKRFHKFPKIFKNTANVYVTDSAYKIKMKENYNIDSFIYSFFNIITLIFAELTGRKYGGGVIELIPSEFKNLPFFYHEISSKEFDEFNKSFNESPFLTSEIIEFLKLTLSEKESLEIVYKKLIQNRLKSIMD